MTDTFSSEKPYILSYIYFDSKLLFRFSKPTRFQKQLPSNTISLIGKQMYSALENLIFLELYWIISIFKIVFQYFGKPF